MKSVGMAFEELAEAFDAIEEIAKSNTNLTLTSITPCDDDVLGKDTIRVEFGIQIPLLTGKYNANSLSLTPQNIRLNDDGSLEVEAVIMASTDTQAQSEDFPQTTAEPGPTSDESSEAASRQSSVSSEVANPTPKQPRVNTDATADEASGQPVYRDPDQLQAVYEEYETFGEMTDALDVDVTPQTVRRYMIKHGIHEPASATGSQTAETLLHADPESVSTSVDETTDRETDSSVTAASPSATQQINESRTDGGSVVQNEVDDNIETAGDSGARVDDSDNENTVEEEKEGDVGLSENIDVDLPDHLTLDDITTTVQNVQTLYEAQQQLNLERDEARNLLRELNLLGLVHGRLATRDLAERTIEDINQCLRLTAESRSDGKNN